METLAEHEAPKKEDYDRYTAEYKPTEKERRRIKHVEKVFQRLKGHRSKYDQNWLDYYKMFRGKQWKQERPDYRHSEVFNLIFRTIQSFVPIMTDILPTPQYSPWEPQDVKLADIYNKVSEYDWKTNNWFMQLVECLYDMHIFGTGYSFCGYDPHENNGLGKIIYESSDPFYAYPDSKSRDINCRRTREFIYAEPVELCEIKRRFPKMAKYVKPDVDELIDKTDLDKVHLKSPTDNVVAYETSKPNVDDKKVLLIEYWEFSDEEEDDENEEKGDQEDGQEKGYQSDKEDGQEGNQEGSEEEGNKKGHRKKYPKGRRTYVASGVLLKDDENPYDDGKIPYQRVVNYVLPREFFGVSEVENLVSPQRLFNKVLSFTLDVLTLMGNPIWVVDTNSEVDTDNIFNRPGEIIEKTPGSEVRREEGVQLQPWVFQLLNELETKFNDISGSTDITRGIRPQGVVAAQAIDRLLETSQTRLRQKSKNLDAMLQNMGQAYISRVKQFYTIPRIVKITGQNDQTEFFRFKMEKQDNGDGTESNFAIVQKFNQDPNTGAMTEGPVERYPADGNMDVKVDTGSLLPFSKAEKESKILAYFDRGLIDREETLKQVEYPNYEEVSRKMAEKEAMAAQAQAQGQGAG